VAVLDFKHSIASIVRDPNEWRSSDIVCLALDKRRSGSADIGGIESMSIVAIMRGEPCV
jgi:hypothetical protein